MTYYELKMKFAVVLVLLAEVTSGVSATSVKNLGISYESCSAAPEAIVINSFGVLPDPVVLPGSVTFNVSVNATVAITSPTWSSFILSYRADSDSEWVDFHCVDDPAICGQPDVCSVLENIFPLDLPCPASFVDNGLPCRCPFEATTYDVVNGALQIPFTLEQLGLVAGEYRLKIVLTKDDVEIYCYSFQATLVDA